MSAKLQANLNCMDIVFDIPDDLVSSVRNKKRWHLALASVNSSRALLSLFGQVIAKNERKFSPISSDMFGNSTSKNVSTFSEVECVIDIDKPQAASYFSNVDQLILSRLVKEKSLDGLAKLGGVEGIAASLRTDVQQGVNDDVEGTLRRKEALALTLILSRLQRVSSILFVKLSKIQQFSSSWQNKQFDRLSRISSNILVEVVRNGRRQQISIFEIVVGDVVCLKIGDQVPADGLFIEGHSLQVDESSMTGESDHVEVSKDQHPFVFSGTKVADGYAKMLVTSVGMSTTWGKVGLAVAFLVLVVLLVRYFTGNTRDGNGNKDFNGNKTRVDDVINAVVRIIAAAVTIVVVAIPEGLPLAVTLTLAHSMKRMMADQAMVRKLSACETMGSATTICTDKTGTLTMNQMKVTRFWLGKESMEGEDVSVIAPDVLNLLHQGVGLNTTGSIYRPAVSGIGFEFSGSPTEKAILSWAALELNMDIDKQDFTVLSVEAFNSEKKRSGVFLKNVKEGTVHAHWKGAAEMILAMCSHYYDAQGNITSLDVFERLNFSEIIQGMACSSLRCIAFACKQVIGGKLVSNEIREQIPDNGLTLLALVGLKDPCRPGAKQAVEDCQYAGVNVKMITGDNIFTARTIAMECGILSPDQEVNDGSVVEGVEFRSYTEEERMEKVETIRVMARSSPFDKLLMVQCLRKKGHVVAVTGDGTNDAPALREADIGLSMGIQGTEVAKESSDIVILDDNFASVATVLRWGRCVYNNIQKFIQFQLTVNVAALAINFVAAVSAGEVPLTAVQLLWVNLIMDTLGALALATENPTKELMKKNPVGRNEPLITNVMWRNLLAQALYQISVLLTLHFKGEDIFHVTKKVNETLIFNTFVLSILQVVMVEFLNKFADTERLNWRQWAVCIAISAASWPIGFLVKFIPVPERPWFSYLKLKRLMFI
ncbi:putative calcium-transporting ATPase 13, plasma membrane-type [Sesamum angolense]|uniref:Calcium-transporting ATPase n=1 Tax=Sesamum angolense TaxID=2727404 RepID=A0AAE1X5S7_9LAMI|nr:putative calcium-transporting ATPase 13, plasma membrane-type [Sesamum angolense]